MDLRRAVSDTISYASYFNFSLYPHEVHHWLISSQPISHRRLAPLLSMEMSIPALELRLQSDFFSEQKVLHTRKLIDRLKYIPGIKLIAITGSVAAKNAQKNDDIDLMFITSPHCLWLIRPLIILLISLFFHRRHPFEDHLHAPDAFCPNLWLDSLSLVLPTSKRSLYTAHEVLQIVPLLDREGTYQKFIQANSWTKKYLANAHSILTKNPHSSVIANLDFHRYPFRGYELWQSIPILILAPLNYLSYLLQLLYMSPKRTTEIVNLHAAFLHTADFSTRLQTHLIMGAKNSSSRT